MSRQWTPVLSFLKESKGFPGAIEVKNLPAMQEMRVKSLGGEDQLEKEMATHSSILGREIPWTEEPGGLPFMGLQRVRQDWATKCAHTHKRKQRAFQWV